MEKPAVHQIVVLQVKVIYCIAAALGLSVIAGLDLYAQKYTFAIVAASFSSMLLLYAGYLLLHKKKSVSPYAEWSLTIILGCFTVVGIQIDPIVAHWVYFFPIYVYFLFPFKPANYITLIYSAVIILVVFQAFDSHIRLQLLFSYSACYAFSMVYAFINERSNLSLSSMINTDPTTQVYNEHQLINNLKKEMTRSDRQRISLTLIAIQPPQPWQGLKAENYEYHMVAAGKQIQQSMRQFDTCYRLKNDCFIIVLPSSNTDDAHQVIESIADKIAQHAVLEQGMFAMECSKYQAEDTEESILQRLMQQLKQPNASTPNAEESV